MRSRCSGSAGQPTARRPGGRLLNEFLISLGLFFLILTAALVILGSASRSASNAAVTREAVALAREGMEDLIISAPADKAGRSRQSFSGRENDVTFHRLMLSRPLTDELRGLISLQVEVKWDGSDRVVRLERYVRRI